MRGDGAGVSGRLQGLGCGPAYLGSCDRLLAEECLGQLPEILDGDAPHTPRGCDAQAWSVTEALRVWRLLEAQTPRQPATTSR